MSDPQRTKDAKLSEVELTPEQRKRALELFRSTDGVFHDLAIACQNIIWLRDENARLQNILDTLELGS
jgi:hypothetical protein